MVDPFGWAAVRGRLAARRTARPRYRANLIRNGRSALTRIKTGLMSRDQREVTNLRESRHARDDPARTRRKAAVCGTAGSCSRPRRSARQDQRLWRLPHRPSCGRWGTAKHHLSDRSRPRGGRSHRCLGSRRKRRASRCARRRSLARLNLRALSILPGGQGKSLRQSRFHRIHAGRRLCHPPGSGRALLLSTRRARRGCRTGAPAVRRPDRLALACDGRSRPQARHLRLRRGGTHRSADGSLARTGCLRLHSPR